MVSETAKTLSLQQKITLFRFISDTFGLSGFL